MPPPQTPRPLPSRSRARINEDGSPKSMYGLYSEMDGVNDSTDETIPDPSRQEQRAYNQNQQGYQTQQQQQKQQRHHRRQWKDRLRQKFDAALGLRTPSSISSSQTYYDSWKTQMEQMDDGHKERLRNKMSETDSSAVTETPSPSMPISTSQPNNRRARMRSMKSNGNRPPPPQQQEQQQQRQPIKSRKSRLDEVPFWREKGSIASLLFDNQDQSSLSSKNGKGGRHKRNKLEVC